MIGHRSNQKDSTARMRTLIPLLLALVITGCQLIPSVPDSALYQRGVVVLRDGTYMFRACARQSWRPVTQLPPVLQSEYWRQRHDQEEMPLYVEGLTLQEPSGWQLLEPYVIGGGLAACEQHLEGALLWGAGEHPDWRVRLEEQRMVLSEPGRRRQTIFRDPRLIRRGHLWQWDGHLERRGNRLDLLFEVQSLPCRDESGHWYALTARALLEGDEYGGCARYGDLQLLNLAARYDPPSSAESGITLLLRGDGGVRLVEHARNGQVLNARPGQWRLLGDSRLLLELTGKTPEEEGDTLLWRQLRDGRLLLVGDHPRYGRGVMLDPGAAPLQWQGRPLLP